MCEEVKVSLVIPVYNVEKYLKRCMDALEKQTLQELEFVFVNDGSPDGSLSMLREFQKHSSRNIQIIDKKNAGVYLARIDGIQAARGKYIGFVDPDDEIEPNFAQTLYTAAEEDQSDLVICGFARQEDETQHILSKEMCCRREALDVSDSPERLLSVNTALWNKLYRAEVLKDLEVLENPPKAMEDTLLLLLAYRRVRKVSFLPDCLYHYMVHADSAITTIKKENVPGIESGFVAVRQIYLESGASENLMQLLTAMMFLHCGISLMLRRYEDRTSDFSVELSENRRFLDSACPEWRKCRYLRLFFTLCRCRNNLKIAVMKKVYLCHMLRPFLRFYKKVQSAFGIDIKW